MHKRTRNRLWRLVILVLVLAAIWWPQISHYRVETPHFAPEVRTAATTAPSDELLARFAPVAFEPRSAPPPANTVADAEQILRGQWNQPNFGLRAVHLPFDKSDVTFG